METCVENKRTPNFSRQEEDALLQLVQKYKNMLECKTTNSIQNRYLHYLNYYNTYII
jgi:hypothetical protein